MAALQLFPIIPHDDGFYEPNPNPEYGVSQKSKHRRARKLNMYDDVPNKRICINLAGVRSKSKPYRMLLDSDDEDAFYEGSDSEDEDKGHDISQINGSDLLTFTEDQERTLIPSTKTYNIDIFKKNEYEIGHRLLIAPKKRNIGDNIDFNLSKIEEYNKENADKIFESKQTVIVCRRVKEFSSR